MALHLLSQQKSHFLLSLMLLMLLNFLGNYYRLPLFFNIDLVFSNIPIFLSIYLFGAVWGGIFACVGGIYSFIHWENMYEVIILLSETTIIALTWRRYARNLVLLEAVFRLCIGLPLIYIVGEFVTPWDASQTLLIALTGLINGVLNAAIASLLILYLPLAKWTGRNVSPLCPSLRHILINLITAFTLLPTLTLLVIDSWQLINKVKAEIITTLNTVSSSAATNLHLKHATHNVALNDFIHGIEPFFTQLTLPTHKQHLQEHVNSLLVLFPEFHQLTLTDTQGNVVFTQSQKHRKPYAMPVAEEPFVDLLETQIPETFVTLVNIENKQRPLLVHALPIFHQQDFVGTLLVHFQMPMRRTAAHNLKCTLIDDQQRVIDTTRSDLKILQLYDHLLPELKKQDQPHLLLPQHPHLWQEASYIKQVTINSDLPISLVVEMPMQDYIHSWQQLYTHRLLVLAGIVLIGLVFAMLISYHLVSPLLKLIHITHDLPTRLEKETIHHWPQSKIHEIDTLTRRFAVMASSLQARFAEIYATKDQLEQRVAERTQELQQEKSLLFNLIDAIPALIYYKDNQGRYLGCNQAFECFVSCDEKTLIGKTDDELFRAELAILFSMADEETLKMGIQQKYEKCVQFTPEQKMLLETLKTPFFDTQGKLLGAIGVCYDLTSRKQIEEALRQSQDRLKVVIDNIPQSIFWKDDMGVYLGCNRNFADAIGFTEPEEIIGKTDIDLVARLTQQPNSELLDALSHCHTQETEHEGEQKQIKSIQVSGEEHWLEIHKMLLYGMNKQRIGILCSFEDITEQRRSEDKLRQAAKVMEYSTNGIAITNANTEFVAVNKAFTQITGFTEAEILGKPTKALKSGEHTKEFYQRMWTLINTTGHWEGEIWNRRKSGEIFLEWLHITVIKDEQTDEVTHYMAIFSDITARKQTEQKLAYLAHYDDLTGLAKRSLFYEMVDRALRKAERSKRFMAVLFLDLDRFKYVNDTWGHAIGDLLLKDVASRLTNCLRRGDNIARLGGDEFTAVLENVNSTDEVVRIVKRIIDAMQLPFHLDGNEAFVTASVGISLYPNDGNDVETLIRNADAAMYRAKESGKNNYEFFTSNMTGQASQRLSLETKLRYALERNELKLYYQPQMHLASGHIVGVEVLLRWQHPEMGLVHPQTFIPLAEETGLIVEIGEWVLRRACLQHQRWRDNGQPMLRMAVNLSPRQFKNSSLMTRVLQVLEETHMDPCFLELEITESMLMQDTGASSEILHKFKEMGVQLAIDDFGTEYSSLSYLKKFPISKLKIDQSFIRGIPQDKDDMAITRAIIALARSLNLSVVAEGVENKSQLIFLKAAKCDEVQGYFIGQPVPEDQLMAEILLV